MTFHSVEQQETNDNKMTEVAKFNVGGHPYQVSRSFLALHPQTIFAISASNQWHEDYDSEIFIDRDGETFRHVLTYLRDGKVTLPLTAAKEALLSELEYYGVEGVDEKNVNDSLIKEAQTVETVARIP